MITTSRPRIGEDPAAAGDFDRRLQLSRRLDWRFLMPSPELGRVLCLGPTDRTLREGLSEFSRSLTAIDAEPDRPLQVHPPAGTLGPYDVAVTTRATTSALRRAAALVRASGFLYVEIRRPPLLRRRWQGGRALGGCRPRDVSHLLAELGFVDLGVHWHWPSFAECTAMIPLDDRQAVRRFIARQSRSRRGRWKALAAAGLHATGMLTPLIRCFSVIARKGGSPGDARARQPGRQDPLGRPEDEEGRG